MTSGPDSPSGAFEVVRRGYAKDQVEASVRELDRRLRAADNARRMAEQHAASLAEELRTLRAGTPAEGLPATPMSFGFRAEKVVRLAEREALLLRQRSEQEVADLRGEAEHEAADLRAAAERDAAEIRAAAERTAEELLASTTRDAGDIRSAATREAAELMGRAHASAGEARAEADVEQERLTALRGEVALLRAESEARSTALGLLRAAVRADLARVHEAIGVELRGLDGPQAAAPEFDASAGRATGTGTGTERPSWTPTPGTRDLFATPPRPAAAVRLPAQREEPAAETRPADPDPASPDGPDSPGSPEGPESAVSGTAGNRHLLRPS